MKSILLDRHSKAADLSEESEHIKAKSPEIGRRCERKASLRG